ncbi:hypothetical protein WJX72_002499 [[Myrmecia] bisecta]|uniref:Cyanuric acid amidohydrolase n=1 Tax=[Myrmecia] bisecta TaxID=41462 RepID=A0AAW1R4F5_9CHLO
MIGKPLDIRHSVQATPLHVLNPTILGQTVNWAGMWAVFGRFAAPVTPGPEDVSGLAAAIKQGQLTAQSIVAIMGKTEGNGCVNDFTRGYATQSIVHFLAEQLGVPPAAVKEKVALVMSGGTEGAISPHLVVFCIEDPDNADGGQHSPISVLDAVPSLKQSSVAANGDGAKRLAMGVAFTRDFLPEEQGRMTQVLQTAEAVHKAMAAAGICRPEDVHFVQIKCPLLTKGRMEEAASRGKTTATANTYASMAYSRAASALGVAVALGEVPAKSLTDADICNNWGLYSGCASTSSGIELLRNEVLVLGNSSEWGGNLVVGHAVMQDAIDADAARNALEGVGIAAAGQLSRADRQRVVAVLAKAEASHDGLVRGRRHTMQDDSDISATRHARAVVGGVLAGLIGDTMLYVSGGAEHQGPDGGGPVAIIAKAE